MSRVLTALLFTVVMILAAYFLLAVIAYAGERRIVAASNGFPTERKPIRGSE